MTKIVITEKPSVAKDISKVLGNFQNKNGFLANKDYHITWAVGHLVELAPPDEYVGKGKWNFANLPIIPQHFKLNVSAKTARQYNIIKELIKNNQYEYIICATDAGREGELIFRYIYQTTNCTLPVKRLWISSMTAQDIKKGFENLLDGAAKDNLAKAAYCRAEADWLVGMNASRSMSVKHNTTFSVGRVQTPTLAMIVKREMEIRNFVPLPYWEVIALFEKAGNLYKGKYVNDKDCKIATKEEANAIADAVKRHSGYIESVKKKKTKEFPPKLYNLTDLQRECNKKYGFSAASTLKIAQRLYEEFKYITYPRTDSNHLATAQIPTFSNILMNLHDTQEFTSFTGPLLDLPQLPINKRFVDDKKLSDHHAIIPTEIKPNLNRLNNDERKVFSLIAKRFIAVFYGPCKAENTSIITRVQEHVFKTTGKVISDPGWTVIYAADRVTKGKDTDDRSEQDKGEEDNQTLPPIKKGESYKVIEATVLTKETRKPAQFTEATLLSAMETAGKLIEDEELKAKMKGMSLGTPATRASIIETLITRQYIERKGKKLIPTEKGTKLIELLPVQELNQPELTAHWEKRLSDIEKGLDSREAFMKDIKEFTAQLVTTIKTTPVKAKKGSPKPTDLPRRKVVGLCPKCGGNVVKGNFAWGCLNIREKTCDFKISFKYGDYILSDNQAEQLLSPKRQTEVITDLALDNKSGSFRLDNSNSGKVVFVPCAGK